MTPASQPTTDVLRLKLAVRGAVQGVGFRPFVFRLATELQLRGGVRNSPAGVLIEAEGRPVDLESLAARLESEAPPASRIQGLELTWLDPAGLGPFSILPSESDGPLRALVLPDIATCPDCLREILDPHNRRYLYPFTNCTQCGPRFTIIESMPYDRPGTSMKHFVMCPACQAEYDHPADRRFHAQPNACPVCGPHLQLWDADAHCLTEDNRAALEKTAAALREGRIVAVKGVGGFHLMTLATDEAAVIRLRRLKQREAKPFAVMADNLERAKAWCRVSPLEEHALRSPEAPIVLLQRRPESPVAPAVAPENPCLGILLPSNPLHHLLLRLLGAPVVATSGNLSDEPICTDEHEAAKRLHGLADFFLVHNRPIVRHADDSIVRIVGGREMVLRRARGYAPFPVTITAPPHPPILAVGAHLKNSVALGVGSQIIVGQHIGDLETPEAQTAFQASIRDLARLHQVTPQVIAADAHPDYVSSRYARELAGDQQPVPVQHHLAHVLACLAESELAGPVLGVSWDGTGYGLDQTVWGGEFFRVTDTRWERVAHLRPFPLPGGEAAVREARRSALGLLLTQWPEAWQSRLPENLFTPGELRVLPRMISQRLNSPLTSSMGRLFDAVASLTGRTQISRFEGEAAMSLEFALDETAPQAGAYPLTLDRSRQPWWLDWAPLLEQLLQDLHAGTGIATISARFHNALAEAIVAVAAQTGESRIVLGGGCFQNCYLVEQTIEMATRAGLRVYWPQRVPPNDGGICVGQVVAAVRQLRQH